jgi:regulator of RNase E activity RraA
MNDLFARYAALSTCQVSDSLGALGLPQLGLSGIYPIDPDVTMVGTAFTVTCRPAEESQGARIEYLGEIPAGAVVVIANGGRVDCSVWGGQRSLAARQRGAVGTVVDGAYRDVREHRALGYPVFGRSPSIVGSNGFANPVAWGETVEVAGVVVRPGDLVLGDVNGVVVVPVDAITAVLEHAETEAARERQISAAVAAGTDFFEARAAARNAR